MSRVASSTTMVLVVELPAGQIAHDLPLPAGLDPLRWLAAAARHIPALRDPTATAWCEPKKERAARHRSTSPTPPPPAAAAAPSA